MTGRTLLNLSFSTKLFSHNLFSATKALPRIRPKVCPGFKIQSLSTAITTSTVEVEQPLQSSSHSIFLEKLRTRHLKDAAKAPPAPLSRTKPLAAADQVEAEKGSTKGSKRNPIRVAYSFGELGLSEEVMSAIEELGISVPTEIQSLGIPAVLQGKSVVLGSHTGSGKTLAYMLPLVQLLRLDESLMGMLMKPRRPRAVVLCPTRELCEQVFRVAKSISHHARFRTIMVSGGSRLRPQEDSLNVPVDMVVGTPGRLLQHIEEGNMVYGDIKYLVLDEADTMFDRGFGPDIRKFLGPLKNRASKPGDQGFQTVLVTATMTKAVQKLVDEEFQGIIHLRTLTLHKKIASAQHDFIKLSGSENKLEALLQVLELSLAKGNRVMVFCNTLNSSRAVDHFLTENQIFTVNYHGEVPAEERVENLKKFKSEDGDCPTLVCTDLAARGLDLDVDHVIMFDFPSNSIDYLHRTGRTARMGAKGKVTSLVAKKNVVLAARIEEAIQKNESLEALTADNICGDIAKARQVGQKEKNAKFVTFSNQKSKSKVVLKKSSRAGGNTVRTSSSKTTGTKTTRTSVTTRKTSTPSKPLNTSTISSRKESSKAKKSMESGKSNALKSTGSKLGVVGFRGRSSSTRKVSSRRPT